MVLVPLNQPVPLPPQEGSNLVLLHQLSISQVCRFDHAQAYAALEAAQASGWWVADRLGFVSMIIKSGNVSVLRTKTHHDP